MWKMVSCKSCELSLLKLVERIAVSVGKSQCELAQMFDIGTSNSSSKMRGAAAPLPSNYLGVFIRFRRTFAEVITFGEAAAHEF